ncbi:MAG: formate--tetrahydrofolate ligase [Deltaproteobacteria bacterium]
MKKDDALPRRGKPLPIAEIADSMNIPQDRLIPYGRCMAKVDSRLLNELKDNGSRLILVTAMSPTPEGVGKTTLTIGLTQSLKLLGKRAFACIRQPSLGPFFGAKGGATGSGRSQALPAEEITMQLTGDDYATVTAHNLISSALDNHIYHGNPLGIDPEKILWRRVSPLNDRALRKVRLGPGTGFERDEEFHISAASEVMSALCLSLDIKDLKRRIGRMALAFDRNGGVITPEDLKVQGAVAALLKNALNPNLAQTVEGAPVFVHGGPFGNISLGCNSLMATRTAMKLADYVVTEAGFSTELGAEKFFNIKCRVGGLKPSATVIVATLGALRLHGGAVDFKKSDIGASINGLENLKRHIDNVRKFSLPCMVAINRFDGDGDAETGEVIRRIKDYGVEAFAVNVRDEGGGGGLEAAVAVIDLCELENNFKYIYDTSLPIEDKVALIAREMYGATGVVFTEEAQRDIRDMERLGFSALPVCMAKTPKSLSDNPALTGAPKGFKVTVNKVRVASGAGFVVVHCGNVLLMPGLPVHPHAEGIDVDRDGNITGI